MVTKRQNVVPVLLKSKSRKSSLKIYVLLGEKPVGLSRQQQSDAEPGRAPGSYKEKDRGAPGSYREKGSSSSGSSSGNNREKPNGVGGAPGSYKEKDAGSGSGSGRRKEPGLGTAPGSYNEGKSRGNRRERGGGDDRSHRSVYMYIFSR
jgi:hypothetical protein